MMDVAAEAATEAAAHLATPDPRAVRRPAPDIGAGPPEQAAADAAAAAVRAAADSLAAQDAAKGPPRSETTESEPDEK